MANMYHLITIATCHSWTAQSFPGMVLHMGACRACGNTPLSHIHSINHTLKIASNIWINPHLILWKIQYVCATRKIILFETLPTGMIILAQQH